ncbi:hypothetical protein [Edaphobacter aggregans]|uniref:hypothetical protein n=1 Tax=Edaphobacter aggregans TaxID=570835 RepID=UPI000553225F|nr:hypothetical protein [Edaphobacter aggregans]
MAALACAVSLIATAAAQQNQPRLEVHTTGGQTTFRIGERIPLELSFTGPDGGNFQVSTSTYDRSGRMISEDFDVKPATGWADPLATYFVFGKTSMGGASAGPRTLSSTPFLLPLNLNEWVRFDQPGDYTVTVSSHRVGPGFAPFANNSPLTLQSKPIRLHIIAATPDWQDKQFAAIVAQLTPPFTPGMQSPEPVKALADLRFLGTRAAIDYMAKNLRDDRPELVGQCAFGLIGVPEALRPAALAALNRELDDPDFPVSYLYFSTAVALQRSGHGTRESMLEEGKRADAAAWQAVFESLPRKNNKAQAATAQSLTIARGTERTSQQKAQLVAVLASRLLDLPPAGQTQQLFYNWDAINSPSILPALRTMATKPVPASGNDVYSQRELKSAALYRWYQLDPTGARRQILEEIGTANPSLGASDIWFLSDKNLPQFEGLWTQGVVNNMSQSAGSLLVRFGTGATASTIASFAAKQINQWPQWACVPPPFALAYLVKFAPDMARPLLEQANAARAANYTPCNLGLFRDIASYAHGPVLTAAAIAALNGQKLDVARDAVNYLSAYGDRSAEEPLWDRYRRWNRKWSGRVTELEQMQAAPPTHWSEISFGQSLAQALSSSQGFLSDSSTMQRIRQLCLVKQVCNAIATGNSEPPYRVTLMRMHGHDDFAIAQYHVHTADLLEAKIQQFPRGTTFLLMSDGPEFSKTSDQKAFEQETTAIFERHGMKLEPSPR